jgi:hypothetical protein
LRGTPSPLAVSTKIFGYEGRKVKPVIASANVGLAQQRPFARNLQRERELPIGTLWGLRPPAISQTDKHRSDDEGTLISTDHRQSHQRRLAPISVPTLFSVPEVSLS